MCGFAAHVDRTGDHCVEFTVAQRPDRDADRVHAGQFLAGDREPEAPEITLGVDPVGRDVRHGPDHAVGGQLRRRVPVRGQPRVVGHVAHAQPLPRDGRIAAHTDDDAGAFWLGADVLECLGRGGEHRRLLGEAALELLGRESEAAQSDFHRLQRRCRGLRAQRAATEALGVRRVAGHHTHPADHDVVVRWRGPARLATGRRTGVALDDQVCVVPAEPEVADRGPLDRALPGGRGGRQRERAVGQCLDRLVAQRRWDHRCLHRREHVHQACRAGHGDGVAEVAFERTEFQRNVTVGGGDAAQLRRVAERRARGVAVEVVDVARRDTGLFQGREHRPGLTGDRGGEESALSAVVGQADTRDDTEDPVAGAFGVLEAFQRDERGARRRHQPVGVGVERPGPAGHAQRLQRGEAEVQEQVVGAVDPTGDHHVGGAIVQRVAGQLDRVQRGRARRVEGVRRPRHAHRPGDQVHRQPRTESVAGIDVTVAGPHTLDERRVHRARIGQVADDQPGARRRDRSAERLLCAVRQPPYERVEALEIGDLRGEVGQIEGCLDVTSGRRRHPQPRLVTGQQRRGVHAAPMVPRGRREQTAAGQGRVEQRLRRARTGQYATATDDGDWVEPAHDPVPAT
ncbi:hypothetical protein MPP7335_04028 [Mycolicibacterium parafortuitum]|uniref:Uncharacterized protein n=1 Tax=Mycolicibacterium parafortuitum TaxID=39692 RepID=A0A375YM83_MYCPF|nr:hypothetical protein MPP7335_04028 [Mycolicibacterium parafortuitum]